MSSAHLSVASRYSIETTGRIELFARRLSSTYPIGRLRYRKILVSENKGTSLWNFVRITLDFESLPRHVDTSIVAAQHVVVLVRQKWDKLATVVDRSNYVDYTCCGRRSTDDRRQFITLSVLLCVFYSTMRVRQRQPTCKLRLSDDKLGELCLAPS